MIQVIDILLSLGIQSNSRLIVNECVRVAMETETKGGVIMIASMDACGLPTPVSSVVVASRIFVHA